MRLAANIAVITVAGTLCALAGALAILGIIADQFKQAEA